MEGEVGRADHIRDAFAKLGFTEVLQFNYAGKCVNILDTPGHQDFSEDTYRTLMAADSAVMVIDAAKGVEAQTIKLFKVCTLRHIPTHLRK